MIQIVLTLFLAQAHGSDTLRERLNDPSCETIFHAAGFEANQLATFEWIKEITGHALGPTGMLLIVQDTEGWTANQHEARTARVERTLARLAKAEELAADLEPASSPFDWQLEIQLPRPNRRVRPARIVADRLTYHRVGQRVLSGEFVGTVEYDAKLPASIIEQILDLARSQAKISPHALRVVHTPDVDAQTGSIYFTHDLPGGPATRLRRTLILLDHLNEELDALGVR